MNSSFSDETKMYFALFINMIRPYVLPDLSSSQKVILFLDPQTEFAELKFEFYDGDSNFKEVYGGISHCVFKSVIQLFQTITCSMKFSFLDHETINKITETVTEHFNKNLPEYNDEVDYCYAIIELE